MSEKDIQINQFNGTDYDSLYPITKSENVNVNAITSSSYFSDSSQHTEDEILNKLGSLYQYYWKRRSVENVKAPSIGSTIVATNSNKNSCPMIQYFYGTDVYNVVKYSDTVDIDSNNNITLHNPRQSGSNPSISTLYGKYIETYYYNFGVLTLQKGLVYIPNNASTFVNGIFTYASYANVSVGTAQVYGEWEYVYSISRTTYPDSGISNGYEYMYLGQPMDNAINASQLIVSNYVGTGTYGSTNQNTFTIGVNTQLIIIIAKTQTSNGSQLIIMGRNSTYTIGHRYGNSPVAITVTWTSNTVSWYSTDSGWQCNISGTTYYFIEL